MEYSESMEDIDRDQIKVFYKEVSLTEREQKIIEYRFGLTDGVAHTLEETGKLYGVTRERIRQIETKAIEKIKEYIQRSQTNKTQTA